MKTLKDKVIETTTNKIKAEDGKYYNEDEVVVLMGIIYSKNSPKLIKDVIDNELIPRDSSYQIVTQLDSDGKQTYGYTLYPLNSFVQFIDNRGNRRCTNNEEILKTAEFHYYPKRCLYVHKNVVPNYKDAYEDVKLWEFNFLATPVYNQINGKSVISNCKENIESGVYSPTYISTEGKRYTFGVEIETVKGKIPGHIAYQYNWKGLYDGSLKESDGVAYGAEYVTGVLTGDSGFHQLRKQVSEIANRCKIDSKCSVHVHIGNMNTGKREVVAAYMLGYLLQEELMLTVPPSRRGNTFCRDIQRIVTEFEISNSTSNQQKYLIESFYQVLFDALSVKKSERKITSKSQHPMGPKCQYQHQTPRYWWLNLIPMAFNTRESEGSKTLEFRLHSASMNFTKIRNWVKFCMAFCYYVENNYMDIFHHFEKKLKNDKTTELTMNHVIMTAYPRFGHKLVNYFDSRKQLINSRDYSENMEFNDGDKAEVSSINNTALMV